MLSLHLIECPSKLLEGSGIVLSRRRASVLAEKAKPRGKGLCSSADSQEGAELTFKFQLFGTPTLGCFY